MSFIQRLAQRLVPKRARSVEAESREWFLICPRCGHERSWWDAGGVRYGARSRGKRTGMRCGACGKFRMHRVEHRPSSGLARDKRSD